MAFVAVLVHPGTTIVLGWAVGAGRFNASLAQVLNQLATVRVKQRLAALGTVLELNRLAACVAI